MKSLLYLDLVNSAFLMLEREQRYKILYGAVIKVKDGENVDRGQNIVTWDPHSTPIITETAGIIEFEDFEDGISVENIVDELTGILIKKDTTSASFDKTGN